MFLGVLAAAENSAVAARNEYDGQTTALLAKHHSVVTATAYAEDVWRGVQWLGENYLQGLVVTLDLDITY